MNNETTSARSNRRSAGLQSGLNLLLVIFLLLAANYIGFKIYAHKDLSISQFYTLSPKTKDVLRNLNGTLRISTLFVSNQGAGYWEETQNLLKEYERIGGKNVTLEKIDPVYDSARAVQLQNQLHLSGRDNLIIFEYTNKNGVPSSRVVKQDDLVDQNPETNQVSGYKGEQQFTGTIVALIEGKSSKVYFTAGHGEHPYNDLQTTAGFGLVAQQLTTENITTQGLNLAAKGAVPADADALVIAGPTVPFSPSEAQAIDQYLAANGKVFVLLDPLASSGLDDVLKKYGLGFDNDIILSRMMTNTGSQSTQPLAVIMQNGFSSHPITAKFPAANYFLALPDARSVQIQTDNSPSPRTSPLLTTGPDSWGWIMKPNMTNADLMGYSSKTFDKTSDIAGPMVASAVFDAGPITTPGSKVTKNGTRIVIIGSARFLENDVVQDNKVGVNFFVNSVDWLVKENAILDISPKRPQEYGISLSPMSARTVAWTSIIVIPGLALLLGVATWISRRK